MSINLTVPAELLAHPDVAHALSALVLALGGNASRQATLGSVALGSVALGSVALGSAPIGSAPIGSSAVPAAAPWAPEAASRAAVKPAVVVSYDDFYAGLPPRSQAFLDMVRDRGVARVGEVVTALSLTGPKAVGGITGAIGRWGPARGVELPYEAITLAGERAWRWIAGGKPAPLPSARQLAEMAPIVAVPTEVDPIDRLLASLPDAPRRMLELVRRKGAVTMAEVLGELGMAKAAGIQSHLRTINEKAAQLGVPQPYERTSGETGESGFRWLAALDGGDVLPFDRDAEGGAGGRESFDRAGNGVRRRRGRAG